MLQITKNQIIEIAKEFQVDYPSTKAVILKESSGSGFQNGRILIQFEPHVFSAELTKRKIKHDLEVIKKDSRGLKTYKLTAFIGDREITIVNGVETQTPEWKTFEIACQIHRESALLATSYGMGQIMGFNYRLAGFRDQYNGSGVMISSGVETMFKLFSESEYYQVRGMFNFIKAYGLIDELQRKDWKGFAAGYNKYAVGYAEDLEKYYKIALAEK